MTDKDILEKRCFPALDEMYLKSECVFSEEDLAGTNFVQTYKNVCEFTDIAEKPAQLPFMAFLLDDKVFSEILEKHSKRFVHTWRFVGNISPMFKHERESLETMLKSTDQGEVEYARAELDRDDKTIKNKKAYDRYRKEIEDLYEKAKNTGMKKSDVNREESRIAEKYGCKKRSYDKERYSLFVCDTAPNSNKVTFHEIKDKWAEIMHEIKPVLEECRKVGDRERFVKTCLPKVYEHITDGDRKWMKDTMKTIFLFYTNIVFDTRTNELKICRKY